MANVDALAALSSEEMRRLIEERKRQQQAEAAASLLQGRRSRAHVTQSHGATSQPQFHSDFATSVAQPKPFEGSWTQRSPGTRRDFTPSTTIESPTNMYNLHPRGEGEFYGTPTVPLDQYEARTGVGSSQYQRDIAAQKLAGTMPSQLSDQQFRADEASRLMKLKQEKLELAKRRRAGLPIPQPFAQEFAETGLASPIQGAEVPPQLDSPTSFTQQTGSGEGTFGPRSLPVERMSGPEIFDPEDMTFGQGLIDAAQGTGHDVQNILAGFLLKDPKDILELHEGALRMDAEITFGSGDRQKAQLAEARRIVPDHLVGTPQADTLISERYNQLERELGFIQTFPEVKDWLEHTISTQKNILTGYFDRQKVLAIAARLREQGGITQNQENALQGARALGTLMPGWALTFLTGGTGGAVWFGAMIGGQEMAELHSNQWMKKETLSKMQTLAEASVAELAPEIVAARAWLKRSPAAGKVKIPRTKVQLVTFLATKLAKGMGLGFTAEGAQEGATGVMELLTDLEPAQRREAQEILSTRGVDAFTSYIINDVHGGIDNIQERLFDVVSTGAWAGGLGKAAFSPLELTSAVKQAQGAALAETVDALNRIAVGEELTETQQEYITRLEQRAKEHASNIAPGVDVVITTDFIRDPRLEAEGAVAEGTFDRSANQVTISIPGIIDAMEGARFTSFAPIMNSIRRVIGHEAIGHAGLNRFPNLTAKIYKENEAAIKAWIDKSDYMQDFPDIDTNPNQQRNAAEEWVNSLSENDFRTNKKLGLAVKNAAGMVFPGRISAETNIRNLVKDLATIATEDMKGAASVRRSQLEGQEATLAREAAEAARKVVPITRETATATETIPELPDVKLAASKKRTGGTVVPIAKDPRSLLIETATKKATAPNLHIRNSDSRMNSIKEDWENNKDDLDFRRDYDNFEAYEEAEWTLNYDIWIDEVQAEEFSEAAGEVESTVTPIDSARTEEKAPVPLPLVGATSTTRRDAEEASFEAGKQTSVDNILSTFDSDVTITDAIKEGNVDPTCAYGSTEFSIHSCGAVASA